MSTLQVIMIIINCITIISGAVMGYFMRQLRDIQVKMEKTLPEDRIRLLIQDKIEPLEKDYSELNQRMVHIEEKLDLILQKVYEK